MRVEAAFKQINRLFLDSAPVIYYIDGNNYTKLKRVTELQVLVIEELEA